MLSRIIIVLVEPTHPGNIGAAARAMKNMGLSRLHLVKPHHFPSADATSRASGADDILETATVFSTLEDAIVNCSLVIGTSARIREIPWPELSPRSCAEQVAREPGQSDIAILFGREHSGLTNQEMDKCQYLLRIPCNPGFSSLNLAAAVQIISYELRMALNASHDIQTHHDEFATSNELELFYKHLHQTLQSIGFIHPDKSRSIMRRIRRLFTRTRLEKKEIDILRGILNTTQASIKTSE
ncbi:MAG: RNA methyltransferase [Gammaproteobacteria bacterium]|nr:RNA methyltransferase [Gammaproteobacteria bacterium]